MRTKARKNRIQVIEKKACKYEQAVFSWTMRLVRAVDRAQPEGTNTSPSIKKILRKMRTPDQGNFRKLLDQFSDEMTSIHGEAWIKSALNILGSGNKEDEEFDINIAMIHDALDNWTLNVIMYLRAAALIMRHTENGFDAHVRRGRLAAVIKSMRSTDDYEKARKAAKIYSRYRYQPVVLASNRAGRFSMFADPTVCVGFTHHRRVARPEMMPSFTFYGPGTTQHREANYVKDYITFRESLEEMDPDKAAAKMDFWLAARGLSKRPRKFIYASQVHAWDEITRTLDKISGDSSLSTRTISTGKFPDKGRIHPLATHWKKPLGNREWATWHRWWKR